jgi:hypothetical protein
MPWVKLNSSIPNPSLPSPAGTDSPIVMNLSPKQRIGCSGRLRGLTPAPHGLNFTGDFPASPRLTPGPGHRFSHLLPAKTINRSPVARTYHPVDG